VVRSGGSSATGGSPTGSGGIGTGGSTGTFVGTKTPGTAQAGDITVDPTKTHQVVDGFGEADVWQGSSSTAMQTLLFDPVNGIGLTLLRIGIESVSGTSVLMGNAGIADGQACVKYAGSACKVWAAPWSPPASMKENDNVNGGASNNYLCSAAGTGSCAGDDYNAWAGLLAAFPAYYKQQGGVDLYAISAQNEPDWNATYEACLYNASEMVNFIDVLGLKLAALNPPVKVLAAEPDNWGNLWGGGAYGPAILADANANSYVGPIATHDYGTTSAGTYARPAPPANNTHHIWETECTPGDTGPITIATMIYAAFTTGGVNAWHYWWTAALVPNVSSPPPQVYALGNFSKYVRPGYYRVDVTGAPTPSASAPLVVAFTNLADGTVAIIVVNGGGSQNVSFFVAGTAWPASVTPYVTTTRSNLAAGTAITVTAGRFSASLAAQSVTTFVGKP
jgi:glucuronoarabinoxylan endo-1,4-beta-xylanase